MDYISEIIYWQGYEIEVRFCQDIYKVGRTPENHISHIEIECLKPAKSPLPMTETGYRSHHAPTGNILGYGGAVPFVKSWLEHEAQSEKWKQVQEKAKQLTLF